MALSIEPWGMEIDLCVKIHHYHFIIFLLLSQYFLQNLTRGRENLKSALFVNLIIII